MGPWLVWHPPHDIAEPPSIEEVVVLPQLKSPLVEGGPSDPNGPGQYPGRGSGEWGESSDLQPLEAGGGLRLY